MIETYYCKREERMSIVVYIVFIAPPIEIHDLCCVIAHVATEEI